MSRPSRFEPKETVSPREHHEWAARMWRRMDRDGSGFITRQELDCEEFRGVLRKVMAPSTGSCVGGPRYARAEMNMDQAVYFFLRKADINSDNSISFEEFKAFMYALRKNHGVLQTADMIFALFDLNTDNSIEEEEFREIYRFFLGHNPTEVEFQEEWGRLDADGSGRASRDQYVTWLQESQNPIFRWHSPLAESPNQAGTGEMRGLQHSLGGATCTDLAGPGRDSEAWRPWHNYTNFCWHEPTRGKPSHCKMKFRDTSFNGSLPASLAAPFSPASNANATSQGIRPQWNQHLATSHPNWPNKDGKPRQVLGMRKYFSRPQSLPELRRHLESRPGLRDHREALFGSPPEAPEAPRRPSVLLSHEHAGGAAQVLSVASRGKPGGSMRHPHSRERRGWDDHWQTPFRLADHFHPVPTTSIGAPARHLYADLYDDEA